jgi:hypothetical protein
MSERKDRLIQTRVPEKLETTLKDEARRRRTTVSQMIRNVLEDTFDLVDGVVANVDQIVTDSVELAQKVGRDARKIGQLGQDVIRDLAALCLDPLPDAEEKLSHVQAWNEVVLNQPLPCTKCGAELTRGRKAYTGLSDDPEKPRAWLCTAAVASFTVDHDDTVDP